LAQLLFDARRRGLEVPTRRSPPDPAWLEKGVGYGLNLDVPAVPGHLATEERPKRCRQLLASIPTNVCSARWLLILGVAGSESGPEVRRVGPSWNSRLGPVSMRLARFGRSRAQTPGGAALPWPSPRPVQMCATSARPGPRSTVVARRDVARVMRSMPKPSPANF